MKTATLFFDKSSVKFLLMQALMIGVCFCSGTALNGKPACAAPPAEKYIFYWGEMQVILLASDNYSATLEVPVTTFRKSLFTPPFLWDGKTMRDTVEFRFQDQVIKSVKSQKQLYQEYSRMLDLNFGQMAKAGHQLTINDLWIADSVKGAITLIITEGKKDDSPGRRFPGMDQPVVMTREWINEFKWGPFIDEWMQRDYFTVQEVLTTIKSEPFFAWNPYKVQEGMEVQIGPITKEVDIPMQVADLNGMPYSAFAAQFLQSYGHLIKPGMAIEFGLRTAQQHHLEIRAQMQVVADDDPRLKLRRFKDGHHFSFQWAAWQSNWEHLYLSVSTLPDGSKVMNDPDGRFYLANNIASFPEQGISEKTAIQQNFQRLLTTSPEIKVDELDMHDISFDIEYDNKIWKIGPGEHIPDDLKNALLEKTTAKDHVVGLVIKNIKAGNYFHFDALSFFGFLPLPVD